MCKYSQADILLLLRLKFMVFHVHRSFFCQKNSLYKVRHKNFWNIQWTSLWLRKLQESRGRYNFVKNLKTKRTFLGSKQDPKLSLLTTVDFLTMRLHHIYSIQNNKEDINKISKLLYMSQLQMCDFSYTDPWIAVASSLLWCVEWN